MQRDGTTSREFWKDKRVVVTGGAGFLGSFVVGKLRGRRAAEVFVPRSKEYDLRDLNAVRRMLSEARPHIVIHLAARVGGIGANRAHPAEFFYDNLMMGVQLLHESWRADVDKFVAVGTACAYPKFTPVPFREDDLWHGYPEETNAPYGLAKKMLLVQAQAYRQEYGYNAIYLLPVNLYGPGDHSDPQTSHVIPAIIRKCLDARDRNERKVTLWGTGRSTREFLYVEDCAEGICCATERYNSPDPVNLGSGQEISIRELADLIAELTAFQGEFVWDVTQPDGQPRRCLDSSRAECTFGFVARTSLRDGLAHAIAWHRNHPATQTMEIVS